MPSQIAGSSSGWSGGTSTASGRPTISVGGVAVQPFGPPVPAGDCVPSRVWPMMASSDDSTMAARRRRASAARRASVTSRKTSTAPLDLPVLVRGSGRRSPRWAPPARPGRPGRCGWPAGPPPSRGRPAPDGVLDGLPRLLVDDRGRPAPGAAPPPRRRPSRSALRPRG